MAWCMIDALGRLVCDQRHTYICRVSAKIAHADVPVILTFGENMTLRVITAKIRGRLRCIPASPYTVVALLTLCTVDITHSKGEFQVLGETNKPAPPAQPPRARSLAAKIEITCPFLLRKCADGRASVRLKHD